MYARIIVTALVAAGHLAATSDCAADFTPRGFEARKTPTPPVIDGVIDDIVWAHAQTIDDFFAYQSGGDPPAAATTARVLWDEQFLYVAFEMNDVDIRPSSITTGDTGRDAELFRGDVIELFIRESRDSPKYFEFEWSPNGTDVFDARFDQRRFGPPGTAWNTDIEWAVTVDGTIDNFTDQDGSWTVESAIPLEAFGAIATGSEWTFAVARYDFFNPISPTEQLMISTPGDPDRPRAGFTSGFHTYELYDNLRFVVPEPATSSCMTGLALLIPAVRRRNRAL